MPDPRLVRVASSRPTATRPGAPDARHLRTATDGRMLLHMQPTTDAHAARDTAETDAIRRFLSRGGLIDITTTGRRSGQPRRIEIVFHNIDGRLIITGQPRHQKRAWLINLESDPRMTFHIKGQLAADLPATARVITDPAERRATAQWVVRNAWHNQNVDAMTAYSPMIEVTLDHPI
jgi:deazaflavin-dependent oxidoreductase (nitroreductase family)